jgi:hypothetical protein
MGFRTQRPLASSRLRDPGDENGGMMGFLDHLEELRARLIGTRP